MVAGGKALANVESKGNWISLFNGSDVTEHWQGDTRKYVAKDGILVCEKGGKYLETRKEYSDFAFSFEFKLEANGNNGIGIRVPSGGHPSRQGMEIQILDHHGSKYLKKSADGKMVSKLKPWQFHGSIYGHVPAKTGYLKPVGQWNSETIICIKDHIRVILNGAIIVDAHLDKVMAATGKKHAGLSRRKGHISLAGHNDRLEFRNLKVAEF